MSLYTRWIMRAGIARRKNAGEEPPRDMRRCIELFWEIEKTIDEDEQIRLMGEIIDLNRKIFMGYRHGGGIALVLSG